jgi:hypothetical protein
MDACRIESSTAGWSRRVSIGGMSWPPLGAAEADCRARAQCRDNSGRGLATGAATCRKGTAGTGDTLPHRGRPCAEHGGVWILLPAGRDDDAVLARVLARGDLHRCVHGEGPVRGGALSPERAEDDPVRPALSRSRLASTAAPVSVHSRARLSLLTGFPARVARRSARARRPLMRPLCMPTRLTGTAICR